MPFTELEGSLPCSQESANSEALCFSSVQGQLYLNFMFLFHPCFKNWFYEKFKLQNRTINLRTHYIIGGTNTYIHVCIL